MHLLIPYASTNHAGSQAKLRELRLPNLERLIAMFPLLYLDDGDETQFSPPHERAHARALTGINKPPRSDDGRFPWATWYVLQQDPQTAPKLDRSAAWAYVTPCRWEIGASQVQMQDPSALALEPAESQALLEAMRPYFEADGISLVYDRPGRWLACGEIFRGLPTASLDRVIGQAVDAWMPEAPQARALRRLQAEMQMLLYNHPVNDQRQARGLPTVNSFWISGTGRESALVGATLNSDGHSGFNASTELQYVPPRPEDHWHDAPSALGAYLTPADDLAIHIPQALRDAALREDWDAWALAWQDIDRSYCAKLLRDGRRLPGRDQRRPLPQLTLCGERNAVTLQAEPLSRLRRLGRNLRSKIRRMPPYLLLDSL